MRWGVSKAAILFRGKQLGMFTEEQCRAGYIGLNRHGQAVAEWEDKDIPLEIPEVVSEGFRVLTDHFGVPIATVAREMHVQPKLLFDLLGMGIGVEKGTVINLFSAT